MTRASNEKEFPGVSVVSGGREVWSHNPDRCEIDYVSIDEGALAIKCSAGGADRGVSIEISLSFDLIVKVLPEVFTSFVEGKSRQLDAERRVAEINLDAERRVAEIKLSSCSETWLPVDIDFLPLQAVQRRVLRESGINTVADLCSKTTKDLIGIRGIGEESVWKIKSWLRLRNLHLK